MYQITIAKLPNCSGEIEMMPFTRPLIREYNDYRAKKYNNIIKFPETLQDLEEISEYSCHCLFETEEEAQDSVNWFTNFVKTLENVPKTYKNHYSDPKNYFVEENFDV